MALSLAVSWPPAVLESSTLSLVFPTLLPRRLDLRNMLEKISSIGEHVFTVTRYHIFPPSLVLRTI